LNAMNVPLVRKIGLLKDYLKIRPHHSLREGSKVIDIGGSVNIMICYDLQLALVSCTSSISNDTVLEGVNR